MRFDHVQSRQLLWGGGEWGSYTRSNCVQWSGQRGGWDRLPLKLSEIRVDSNVWARGDQLVIMGGIYSDAGWNSERISIDGSVTSSSFSMKYETS